MIENEIEEDLNSEIRAGYMENPISEHKLDRMAWECDYIEEMRKRGVEDE